MKKTTLQIQYFFVFGLMISGVFGPCLAFAVAPSGAQQVTKVAPKISSLEMQKKRLLTDDAAFYQQKIQSEKFLFQNLVLPGVRPGIVVASPSQTQPNYFFHWVRDAAVSFMQIQSYFISEGGGTQSNLQAWILAHLSVNLNFQAMPNLISGLGEPKFNFDGNAFQGPWGRPQTDGPALRAISFIYFLNRVLNENWPNRNQIIQRLYDAKLPTHSLIKSDLEYVAHNWRIASFDLWEEAYGAHFFTLMVQRRALLEGARVAKTFSDNGAADFYTQQAQQIAQVLNAFWNPNVNYILTTINMQSGPRKNSMLDSSVLLAAIYGDIGDGYYAPYDDRVLASLQVMREVFQRIYPINQNQNLGIAIGRYPEDTYDGVSTNGVGNPWFIGSQAAAEVYYRTSLHLVQVKRLQISAINLRFYNALMRGQMSFTVGQVIAANDPALPLIARQLFLEGDRELELTIIHRGGDGSLSEQINRTNGYMQGAVNLTWSHASYLSAVAWRTYVRKLL